MRTIPIGPSIACPIDVVQRAGGLWENLFLGAVGAYPPQSVVESWYEEIDQYDHARPDFSVPTEHFTQVVWQRTKQLGRGNNLWVCRYSPHGNVTGQIQRNVPKPCR